MRNLIVFILVLAVIVGIVGYYQGWFTVNETDGKTNLQFDKAKFRADRDAFEKTASEKMRVFGDNIANLFKKSEKLKGDEKEGVQAELRELKKTHDRLEKQIQDLGNAAEPKFESIKHDLSSRLEEVDKKIEELTKKLG